MRDQQILNHRSSYGSALCAICVLPTLLLAAPVELKQTADHVDVLIDGKAFTTYYFGSDVAKSYLMPLQTASGIVISRVFPVKNTVTDADARTDSFEPHQRPLYFAHGDIDGLDFWGEAVFQKYYGSHTEQPYGHMAGAKLSKIQDGTIQANFLLKDPANRVIGEEAQSLAFHGDDRTRTIDCKFVLKATQGDMTLGDTKEGTFGIRLGPGLSQPRVHMINSHGGQGEKEIWGKPADWVAYMGNILGKDVGVAVFDHPKSFRHPTTWHARAYGLLAANPFGLREFTRHADKDGSWTIPYGTSLEFRYRVVIYEGDWSPAQITKLYEQYATEP